MMINEVFDVEQHVQQSTRATDALIAFRRQIINKNRMEQSYIIAGCDQLVIYPRTPYTTDKNTEAFVIRHNNKVVGMYFNLPADVTKAVKIIKSKHFESLFRHEFQHYLDLLDNKFTDVGNYRRTDYVNSDVEYEAWFKQNAEPLLAILRAANHNENLERFPKIEADFKDFMRNGQHFKLADPLVPLREFGRAKKLKYIRDMAAIHAAVCALEGVTGNYTPNTFGKILRWVSRKTGYNFG